MHSAWVRGLWLTVAIGMGVPPALSDTLTLKDGRRLTGYYAGGSARRVRFRTESGTREYDVMAVAGIRIDGPTAVGPPAPVGEFRDFFLPDEIRLIRDWFSDRPNSENLPPGLAKRETLPPGLARQLRKNGTLPPGLEKRVEPLPWDLEHRLPPILGGIRRVMIGGNLILLDETTAAILDLVRDVY